MKEVIVDCSDLTSLDEFWQRYVDAAKPEGASLFGRNLDAFWDAVEGGGPGWPGEVTLIFTHSEHLERLSPPIADSSFLESLKSLAQQASFVKFRFA